MRSAYAEISFRPYYYLTFLAHFTPYCPHRPNQSLRHPKPLLASRQSAADARHIACFDLHKHVVPYEAAWKWQQDLVEEMLHPERSGRGFLLLLQHEPVLTLGAGSTTDNLQFDLNAPPLPLHRAERGGEVTYHGPGQLVVYPILDLQQFEPDLHWYLRNLEEVVIRTLKRVSSLEGERIDGLTGVWVGGSKVAAVGIRARRWVTYHGLALNVTVDVDPYKYIVPCGIADKPVTSVRRLLGPRLSDEDLICSYAEGLLTSFQEVFKVQLTSSCLASIELIQS